MVKKSFVTGILAAALAGTFAVTASAQQTGTDPLAAAPTDHPPLTDRVAAWNPDTYKQLHAAFKAYEMCGGSELSEADVRASVRRIEALAGEPTSPGVKLKAQDEAQGDMETIVIRDGCGDERVEAALALFQQRIAAGITSGIAAVPAN